MSTISGLSTHGQGLKIGQPRVFSIKGKGLKLNTRADIDPHLTELKAMPDVERVEFGGNTLGVEASEALAEVLVNLKSLKVCPFELEPPHAY